MNRIEQDYDEKIKGIDMIFYEKIGCAGNARQKQLLKSYGIEFEVKSLLDTSWNKEALEEFFIGLEKEEIVNPFAPKVKKGEIDLKVLSKSELIEIMIHEPILIKRPLIQVDDEKLCGFDVERLNTLFDIEIDINKEVSTCQKSDSCN